MKTNIFNITAIALIISSSFLSGRNMSETKQMEFPMEAINEIAEISSNSFTMVEAKMIDGELTPSVTLPELTIVGEYNKGKLVRSEMVDGELIPVVDLPELTISSK